MKKTTLWLFGVLAVVAAALIFGCSSNNSNSPTGGGGGGGSKEFDSGNVAPSGNFVHVFTAAKVVPYHCTIHGAAGGVGMSGTITVQAGGAPTLHTVSMTNALTFSPATLTINVGDTVKWLNTSGMVHTATSDN